MIRTASYDIVVVGLGGQGVDTVTGLIFDLAHLNGRPCTGAVFKGGAQKAGTIHSELRVLPADAEEVPHSNQILDGSLDLILGLEPHEAMRFAALFGDETRLILNDEPVPFDSERATGRQADDPVAVLRGDHRHVTARNYTRLAARDYGDRRMANILMLLEATGAPGFPFTAESIEAVLRSKRFPDTVRATLIRGEVT
jgi:Pyruvate/2-oxoacid:ferredoxin oxidoreductase gamma subunit